jgi:hypothetical protein
LNLVDEKQCLPAVGAAQSPSERFQVGDAQKIAEICSKAALFH